tara:strand:+ start:122 stop:256 length:135 start_codon:yes stop_codon:yes gene_type:complete
VGDDEEDKVEASLNKRMSIKKYRSAIIGERGVKTITGQVNWFIL